MHLDQVIRAAKLFQFREGSDNKDKDCEDCNGCKDANDCRDEKSPDVRWGHWPLATGH